MPARAAADPVEREPMGLSPATAEALAGSCRKSPSESPLLTEGSAGAAARCRLRLPLHEEERLLAGASRKVVRNLYTHVRNEVRRRGNGEYLPQVIGNPAKYQQMYYVWRLHLLGELHARQLQRAKALMRLKEG